MKLESKFLMCRNFASEIVRLKYLWDRLKTILNNFMNVTEIIVIGRYGIYDRHI